MHEMKQDNDVWRKQRETCLNMTVFYWWLSSCNFVKVNNANIRNVICIYLYIYLIVSICEYEYYLGLNTDIKLQLYN